MRGNLNINYKQQRAVELELRVRGDSNYFLYSNNRPYASRRARQNKTNALLLQKLMLLKKYSHVGTMILMLLKNLTEQSFFSNSFYDQELKDLLLYYNMITHPNQNIFAFFLSQNSPQEVLFKIWLKKLCLQDEQDIPVSIDEKKFDSEYLNWDLYQILQAIVKKEVNHLEKIQNAHVMLQMINSLCEQDRQTILLNYRGSFMAFQYILQKQSFMYNSDLQEYHRLDELMRLSQIDLYDSELQLKIIDNLLAVNQSETAFKVALEHALNHPWPSCKVWQFLADEFQKNPKHYQKSFAVELQGIMEIHFGSTFYVEVLGERDEECFTAKAEFVDTFRPTFLEQYKGFFEFS